MKKQDDKVIDLTPYLKRKKHSYRSYGEKIICPVCECTDYFRFYSKVHIDKKIYITALICTSDECDGETIVEIKDGVVN